MEEIKNLPDYAKNKKYIVYRVVDGEKWFYGAWDDLNEAVRIVKEIDGEIFKNYVRDIKPERPMGDIIDGFFCPKCTRRLTVKQRYCKNCGQLIGWDIDLE